MAVLFTALINATGVQAQTDFNALANKVICIDPGHGGTAETDHYRRGVSGEREEWINLRVAFKLKHLLEKAGAEVIMTRMDDRFVPLETRGELAKQNNANLFLSIHHNATADSAVNFPIIYFHGNASENLAGVALARYVAKSINAYLFSGDKPVGVVSDHVIFPGRGANVLRNTYGIPGILGEASFFSNPAEENRLKEDIYNQREAAAYFEAIQAYFKADDAKTIHPKKLEIPPYRVYQEAERMNDDAKEWHNNFENAMNMMAEAKEEDLEQAYDLFSRSIRAFPDSYVAAKAHQQRSAILKKWGRADEALIEALRSKEHYVVE